MEMSVASDMDWITRHAANVDPAPPINLPVAWERHPSYNWRQMPAAKLKLGFIGAGRAGTGLATGFAHAGGDVVAVASRSIASAQALVKRVRGARACAPQEVADRADLVFLTVPDDAIERVAS